MKFLLALSLTLSLTHGAPLAGTTGKVGTLENPKTVNRLEITKSGVYENFRVDAQGKGGNIVKITADDVTLRNCEIFNGSGNGVGVFGTRVVIENCHIHHLLSGTFEEQHDAHGVTGRWGDVTIRNCEISQISGDCVQFDPDRKSRGSLTIEHCHLWAGPLEVDAPGLRGPGGRGDARVTIQDCAIYYAQTGVRAEDKIENLKLLRIAWGEGVKSRVEFHGGKNPPGFENTGEHEALPINELVAKPKP